METNYRICRNEVLIEGVNVGPFERFECHADDRTLGNTAVLTLPLYTLMATQVGEARTRTRSVFAAPDGDKRLSAIKPCAQVEVYCWYEGYDKIKVFAGFIEHVAEGFPAKLHLQDNTYILRFGSIQKGWDGNATLQSIIADCIPIAQEGFSREREEKGFTRSVPQLTYSAENKNVQAVTTALSFRNWGARSPYDTLQRLMEMLVMYGGVGDDFNVYIGAGVTESTRPVIQLDTRHNVIGRGMTPVDGRFVDYDVKITGILANGKRHVATAGERRTGRGKEQSEFEKSYGESFRAYSMLNTAAGLQDFAEKMLAYLRGKRNKGTIDCVLYPKIEIMDRVTYTDSLFPELSGGYYVIGYRFTADENGYFQQLEVTDQIFAF